jgi:hypothetical protein
MSTGALVLLVLVVLLVVGLPSWPYSRNWGYSSFCCLAGSKARPSLIDSSGS